jgi:hypothetical protein
VAPQSGFGGGSAAMYSIFYIIGVIVVILAFCLCSASGEANTA